MSSGTPGTGKDGTSISPDAKASVEDLESQNASGRSLLEDHAVMPNARGYECKRNEIVRWRSGEGRGNRQYALEMMTILLSAVLCQWKHCACRTRRTFHFDVDLQTKRGERICDS